MYLESKNRFFIAKKRGFVMSFGTLIGKGNTAEVFYWNEQEVIKLFYPHFDHEYMKREFEVSSLIFDLGIPTPYVTEIIEHEGRTGIIYEKLNGNIFTQELATKPFQLKDNGRLFAELQAEFHQKTTIELPNQKECLRRNISGTNLLTANEKETIIQYLYQLRDDNKVCHGDYHTDNIILVNGKPKILDWMTGTSGNPCGDVARTLIIMRYAVLPPSMPKITKWFIKWMRGLFTNYYLNSYLKITQSSMSEIEEWILPVMAARLVEGIPNIEKELLVDKIRETLKIEGNGK